MKRSPRRASLLLVLAATSPWCISAPLPFPPLQKEICTTDHVVDKERLAVYLVRKFPLSILAAASAPKSASGSVKDLLAALLADENICTEKCAPGDKDSIVAINGHMSGFLLPGAFAAFKPTAEVDAVEYFRGSNEQNKVECVHVNGVPVEAPSAQFTSPPERGSRWRLRGNPDHLNVDRADEEGFAETSKATLSLARDRVEETKTRKVTAYAGYAFPFKLNGGANGSRFELVPYLGVNRDTVRIGGSVAADKSSDTVNFGLLNSFFIVSVDEGANAIGHQFNIRPDYLLNDFDGSRLLSLQLEYLPVKNGIVNSFIPLGARAQASFKPIFALRSKVSKYTRRSVNATQEEQKDMSHIGAHAGFSLLSNMPQLPLDFTLTYTGLEALKGHVNINYLQGALTLNLDRNKFFGVSLLYSHGKREDTFKKENKWEMALTARF